MLGLSTKAHQSRLREREITFPGLDVLQPTHLRPGFSFLIQCWNVVREKIEWAM